MYLVAKGINELVRQLVTAHRIPDTDMRVHVRQTFCDGFLFAFIEGMVRNLNPTPLSSEVCETAVFQIWREAIESVGVSALPSASIGSVDNFERGLAEGAEAARAWYDVRSRRDNWIENCGTLLDFVLEESAPKLWIAVSDLHAPPVLSPWLTVIAQMASILDPKTRIDPIFLSGMLGGGDKSVAYSFVASSVLLFRAMQRVIDPMRNRDFYTGYLRNLRKVLNNQFPSGRAGDDEFYSQVFEFREQSPRESCTIRHEMVAPLLNRSDATTAHLYPLEIANVLAAFRHGERATRRWLTYGLS